jgi:peptidyl-prolyl cis-trans isomerase D
MITIGKIREKSGLLIGVIGGAMVLYVLGQALSSAGRQSGESLSQGEIYGESVDATHLNELEEQFMNMQKQTAAQQQRAFTDKDAQEAADKAWNEYVRETLLNKEFASLGIEVNDAEIDAYMYGTDGFKPYQMLAQYFPDSVNRGQVDFKALKDFQTKAENGEQVQNGVDEYNQPVYFKYADFWAELRKEISESRKADKYIALLNQGVYVTKIEAQEAYKISKTIKNVSYIERPYGSKFDKTEISDAELKAFYEKHKEDAKYEQKASRKISYIAFDIKPSAEDLAKGQEKMQQLKKEFTVAVNDSAFVMSNGETPSFDKNISYHVAMDAGEPNSYPESIDSNIQHATIGQVVGPYADGEKVSLAKVLGFTDENQAWVRHILITAGGQSALSFEAAQAKADSIVNVIKANNNFVEMVEKYSDDPGSNKNKGEYKWFPEGRMVPEFNDYSFKSPLNTIGTVKTSYGIHIIEVLGRRTAKLPHLAIVSKSVRPSESTINDVEQKAKDFWSDADANPEKFEDLAKKENYFLRPVNVFLEKPQIFGFSATAQSLALRFAFNKEAKLNDISDPIKDGDRFVVMQISSIIEDGVPTLENARDIMEIDAKNDKIAQQFINEMKGTKDLQALSSKLNVPVKNGEVTFISGSINNKMEPVVAGTIFANTLKDGQTTPPIQGNTAVFQVKVVETKPAPATKDYSEQQKDLMSREINTISRNAILALIKFADVKDYRIQNRIGAR